MLICRNAEGVRQRKVGNPHAYNRSDVS